LIFQSSNNIDNKQTRLATAYEEIESDLKIIGVTAVEDKLQAGVDVTLEALRLAGIVIWVLTGDKLETAINISNSCKHFTSDMIKVILSNLSLYDDITNKLSLISDQYAI
jgi:phospholipid-translocating ATPase